MSVNQSVLTAMRDWTSVKAVASTTTVTNAGRTVTAAVAAADRGDVAGTVTFTGEGWTQTVKLNQRSASVEVPSTVRSVTARYDGYTDGRVTASTSAALSLGLDLSAVVVNRCVSGKVTQVATVTNADAVSADVTVAGAFGSKTITVAAGKTVSVTFSTRASTVDAGTLSVNAVASATKDAATSFTVPTPQGSCR